MKQIIKESVFKTLSLVCLVLVYVIIQAQGYGRDGKRWVLMNVEWVLGTLSNGSECKIQIKCHKVGRCATKHFNYHIRPCLSQPNFHFYLLHKVREQRQNTSSLYYHQTDPTLSLFVPVATPYSRLRVLKPESTLTYPSDFSLTSCASS